MKLIFDHLIVKRCSFNWRDGEFMAEKKKN